MSVTLALAGEEKLAKGDVEASSGGACSAFADLFKSLRNLPPSMFKVLAVTAVTWVRTHIHPSTHPRIVSFSFAHWNL
jgi:solute carrier family 45 protein 1/2/4